jgi:hypothetical protein
MPSDRHPETETRLARLDLGVTAADVGAATGPTTVIPLPRTPRKKAGRELHEIRSLFVRKCFDLLTDPKIWAKLRIHLLSEKAPDSLKAFNILATGIVAATETADGTRPPIAVNVINHIPGPPRST